MYIVALHSDLSQLVGMHLRVLVNGPGTVSVVCIGSAGGRRASQAVERGLLARPCCSGAAKLLPQWCIAAGELASQSAMQADDAEAEAAKRETLGAALAAFVAAVRRDRPAEGGAATPTAAELLGPEGKLGLSHILPIYKECAAELVRGFP